MHKLLAAVAVMASGAGAAGPVALQPLDAEVETSSGTSFALKGAWGRPAVLFYEDKDSMALNEHVKQTLFREGRERGLMEAVAVVAVANVTAWNWFPARDFVLAAVRDAERRYGLTVYLDFAGSLVAPPWSLPGKGSTVVLLDAKGVRRREWRGRLGPAEVKALLAGLEAEVR